MLRQIHIQNYALIDSVDLTFQPGLSAITGETGSGKSIVLGALGLLLGERFDQRSVRNPELKCVVEAHFEIPSDELSEFFASRDLDLETITVVRREISTSGKSRAFVNDTPVSLSVLKELGDRLVDIHSQHENSILGDRSFQFSVVDAFAGNDELIVGYRDAFTAYNAVVMEWNSCIAEEARLRQDMDYIRFQLNELEQAGLDVVNQQALEQEVETLQHAEQIQSVLSSALTGLEDESAGAIHQLHIVRQQLQRIASIHTALGTFSERLDTLCIEAKDITAEISSFAEGIEYNPVRIAQLNEQLSEIYRLQQKYRVNTVEELCRIRDEFMEKTQGFSTLDERITELEKQAGEMKAGLEKKAVKLHEKRVMGAERAQEEIRSVLRQLQLEHATLKFQLTPSPALNEFGQDDISLLFSANKGSQMQPIRLVASGGEISRVMLALKAAISNHRHLPVLILDEIDQGVSGEVALRMGEILREMGRSMQVITITHLPQIAGKADHHFKVLKTSGENTTLTHVKALSAEERVEELAEMLGGKKRTQTSLDHAKELLVRN